MARIRTRLEPDTRLDARQPDGEQPDRDAAVKMEGFDMDVARRADRVATPAIGKERPAGTALDKLGIGLGPYQPSPERRLDRRDHGWPPHREAAGPRGRPSC